MAKNFHSEGDLVTKQPNSQGCNIFSLSTGNMGKGSDTGEREVNGNYKLGAASSEEMYKLKTNAYKSGSRVSFADIDGDGNLIKMCSESELHIDQSLPINIGRSLSYSAIERTNHVDSPELLLSAFSKAQVCDTYSISSMDRLSTSPIQEEMAEFGAETSDCEDSVSQSEENQRTESTSQVSEPTRMSIHSDSPPRCSPTGKPPLPNGKSKHRPGSGKQTSWLLRLFESKMFDMSIAISYLFNSKEPGVQTYLGK